MAEDTSLGGGGRQFPSTHWSRIAGADERQRLVQAYWKPVYHFVRRVGHHDNEAAKDLTQSFFVRVLEGDALAGFDPTRGRFRAFLKGALRHHLTDALRRRTAQRRGGAVGQRSLTPGDDETIDPPDPALGPDEAFDRAWAHALLTQALAQLEQRLVADGRPAAWTLFSERDVDAPPDGSAPSYAELAARHGLPLQTVKSQIDHARRQLRRLILAEIRGYSASEDEARRELAELFGR